MREKHLWKNTAAVAEFIRHHYRHFNAAALIDAANGYINLIEDTTGKGHITRNFGPDPRIALTIPLAEGVIVEGPRSSRTRSS